MNTIGQTLLKDRNSSLYEALKSFSAETLRVIEDAVKNSGATIPVFSEFTWQMAGQPPSLFRVPIGKPNYWILAHRLDSSIKALPSYHLAEKEIQADTVWGCHVNKMVGSSISKHRLSLDGLLIGIPVYSLNAKNNFGLSEQCFDEKVEILEQFFISPTVEYIKTTPLYGTTLQGKFSLSDNISIEPLRTDSVLDLLNDGLELPRMFGSTYMDTVACNDFPRAAIITHFSLPKEAVGDDELQRNSDSLMQQLDRVSSDQDMVVDLLMLILGNPIRPLGSVMKSRGYMEGTRSIQKNEINNAWALKKKEFVEDDQTRLNELWPIFDGNNKKPFHFLVIAVRRFSQAMTRSSLDDKLIDLMICAEAIFLRVDKNELRNQLAYKAALLLGKNSVHQKEIFKFFKDAYDIRSQVVHGSKSFMQNDNDTEKLNSIITKLAEHLQNAILKMLNLALSHNSSNELIDWTELMFPDRKADDL